MRLVNPGSAKKKEAISVRERALCQMTLCVFSFRVEVTEEKGHKSCALEMVFRRKVRR